MGAEGLRYPVDELRRKGKTIGGFTTWTLNEPWPNAAGPCLIDYDGRPGMNYDFAKQAFAPVSLALKYSSLLYDPSKGVECEAWLVSDAPQSASGLKWQWVARDRRGQVFGRGGGTASIAPQEVKKLESIEVRPPKETAFGPVFIELRLSDAAGKLMTERIHIFGMAGVNGPLGGLLKNKEQDQDDALDVLPKAESPEDPANLAYVGNGARPATASSQVETIQKREYFNVGAVKHIDFGDAVHNATCVNDGRYGDSTSWIGIKPRSFFTVDFGKTALVGRFKLGRDRTGIFYGNRALGYLKIETSEDGESWRTVFEREGVASMEGYSPARTMEVRIKPVEARFVRVTVDPKEGQSALPAIDEFEAYPPQDVAAERLPTVTFTDYNVFYRPVRRTSLSVSAHPARVEGKSEVLEFVVENTGKMTALFCEPHPVLEYRTDIDVINNHAFIPPGEKRTITVKAPTDSRGGLRLAQTGWRFSCWNADDVTIAPSSEVLLWVGRRDAMSREYAGYSDIKRLGRSRSAELRGDHLDPSGLPLLLTGGSGTARFIFEVDAKQSRRPARLRIHTSDQSSDVSPIVEVEVSEVEVRGKRHQKTLPKGLGIQNTDPAHLAFPASAAFDFPAGTLKTGSNILEISVKNKGWFSWDALDLITR